MRRVLILLPIVGMLTACDPERPTAEGSIVVVAMAGPVCPVESDPPDPSCAPRPVAGAPVVVTPADGSDDVVAQGETDAEAGSRWRSRSATTSYRRGRSRGSSPLLSLSWCPCWRI